MDRIAFLSERYAQLTLAAAYLAGAVVAIAFWSRHPKQSLLVVIAASMSLAIELFFIARWFQPDDFGDPELDDLYVAVDLVARAIAFGLLLIAVFSGRRRQRVTEFFDDGDERM